MSRTLYNCKTAVDGWTFVKFDPDFNISAIYTVKTRTKKPQMVCDCPGWPRKSICKHTRMVNTFALAGAINTSMFYCYKTMTWHQPIQHDGENDPTAEKAAQVVPAGPTTVHHLANRITRFATPQEGLMPQALDSNPAEREVLRMFAELLRKHSNVVGDASSTVIVINRIMHSSDAPEFVRLMQRWMATL